MTSAPIVKRALAAALAAALPALAGCGIRPVPHLSAASAPRAIAGPVRIEAPAEAEGQRLAAALAARLAEAGIAQAAEAPTTIDIALARHPAAMGVAHEAGEENAQPGVTWLSPPRRPRSFDGCKAQRLEATVLARKAGTATVLFKGRGGFDYCRLAPQDVDELARLFAGAMLGR